jgi:hypothetical protein
MASNATPPIALDGLKISSTLPPVPSVSGADPSRAVLDGFRIAVADFVSKTWDVELEKVFAGVDTGNILPPPLMNREERGRFSRRYTTIQER